MGSPPVKVGDRFRSRQSRDRVIEVAAAAGDSWRVRNLEHRWSWNVGRETHISGANLAKRWIRERSVAA